MKKTKIHKTKNYNKFKTVFSQKNKIELETKLAIERLENGNPPFHCKKCGVLFKPAGCQFIFYLLCDGCFEKFDQQKMMGRQSLLRKKTCVKYYEDSDEWAQASIN